MWERECVCVHRCVRVRACVSVCEDSVFPLKLGTYYLCAKCLNRIGAFSAFVTDNKSSSNSERIRVIE